MSANPLSAGTPNCMVVWVPWVPLSENRVRRMHWSKVHAHNAKGKAAWRSSLLSLSAAGGSWMTIIRSLEGSKHCGMPSPQASALTTGISASDFNTLKPKQLESKGVL